SQTATSSDDLYGPHEDDPMTHRAIAVTLLSLCAVLPCGAQSSNTLGLANQRMGYSVAECLRRAERALSLEQYSVDVHRNPTYVLASKVLVSSRVLRGAGILCEDINPELTWVTVVVSAPIADRAQMIAERTRLMQHMDEMVTTGPTRPTQAPAPAPAPAP